MKITSGGGILFKPKQLLLWSASLTVLTACGAVPNSGPDAMTYSGAATEQVTGSNPDGSPADLPFILVDVDAQSVEILEHTDRQNYFRGSFDDRRGAPDIRIGMGDVVRVTIFEAGTGGLFVPTGGTLASGNYVSIPDQEVDRTGSITVPYAAKGNDGGVIRVHNRRPIEVQAEIEQRLADRALEPQVIVSIVNRDSNLYSVIGDVSSPGRFTVGQSGVRILDAIGSAGGPTASAYDTLITLQRGNKTATARMSTLINEPENNIYVRPNDVISLKKEERYYNIYGAVQTNDRVPFEGESMTLADAIAKAGGLDGDRADPQSVILYRREEPDVVRRIGASLDGFNRRSFVPTVYRVDLGKPTGYFLAQKLPLEPNDMIYVADHPFNDLTRILAVVRDILLIRLIDD